MNRAIFLSALQLFGFSAFAQTATVTFPVNSMFGGAAANKPITLTAVNSLVSDGVNLWAGTYTVLPASDTTITNRLYPNDYLLTVAGVVKPARFSIYAGDVSNTVSVVDRITSGALFYFGTNGFASLAAGTNVVLVTNSDGSITVNAAGGGGNGTFDYNSLTNRPSGLVTNGSRGISFSDNAAIESNPSELGFYGEGDIRIYTILRTNAVIHLESTAGVIVDSGHPLFANGSNVTNIPAANVTGLGTAATVSTNTLLTWNTNIATSAAAAALQAANVVTNLPSGLLTNGVTQYRPPVTGCILWCDPAALNGTNGQPVNVFTDISGNGNHLYPAYDSSPYTTATPTNKPIFSDTGINGSPALAMLANWGADGTYPSLAYGLSNQCWTVGMSNTFTLTMVFRDMREDGSATANSFLFMFGTNSAAPLIQPHLATLTYSNGPTVFGNLQSWGGTQLFFNPQEKTYPNVFTLRMNAGQGDLWVNGFLVASNVTYQSGGPIGSLFSIGMKWLHNYAIYQSHLGSFSGYLGDIVLSTNAEPATELLTLQSHLMRKYKIGLNPQVVFFGDSITEGIYARPRSNFMCVAHAMVAGVDFYNQAIPGITASNLIQMQTNWLGCTKDSAIIVTLWGANDMFRGHSFASLTTNTLLSAQYIRSQGRKAVFCTMPSLLWETGYTITRSNYNNWLVANSNLFDCLIRYDLDPDMGYTGAYTNEFLIVQTNSIPSADKVHPTGDAYRLLFTRWTWPAIKQMLQPNVIGDNFTGTFTAGNGTNTIVGQNGNGLVGGVALTNGAITGTSLNTGSGSVTCGNINASQVVGTQFRSSGSSFNLGLGTVPNIYVLATNVNIQNSLIVTNSLTLINGSITGPTNATAPVNAVTPVAWINWTNSTGGVFKMPLYQ